MPLKETEARKAWDRAYKKKMYKQGHYQRNREDILARNKVWSDTHKERVAELSKNHRTKCFDAWLIILKERGMLECSKCGYNKCFAALDFHHVNPAEKEFGLAKIIYMLPTQERLAELDKVVVLCSNCHRELHSKTYFRDLK